MADSLPSPYHPPASPVRDREPLTRAEDRASTRARRLVARLVDWIPVPFFFFGAGAFVNHLSPALGSGPVVAKHPIALALYIGWFGLWLGFCAVQATGLARRGQTLGKWLLRVRVVARDGEAPGLTGGFLLRELPFFLMTYAAPLAVTLMMAGLLVLDSMGFDVMDWADLMISVVESPASWIVAALVAFLALRLADYSAILGNEARCLHDRLAGTWVVPVQPRKR